MLVVVGVRCLFVGCELYPFCVVSCALCFGFGVWSPLQPPYPKVVGFELLCVILKPHCNDPIIHFKHNSSEEFIRDNVSRLVSH